MGQTYTGTTSKVAVTALANIVTPPKLTTITWFYATVPTGNSRIAQKGLAAVNGLQYFCSFTSLGAAIQNLVAATIGGTACQSAATLANFANWGLNKLICMVAQNDFTTAGNNKLLIGDTNNVPKEPSSYTAQVAGIGTQLAWGTDVYVIGNKTNDSGQFVGSIILHAIWPRLLSLGDIYSQWSRPYPTSDCSGFWMLDSNGSGSVIDLSGNNNLGTITALTVDNITIPRITLARGRANRRVA